MQEIYALDPNWRYNITDAIKYDQPEAINLLIAWGTDLNNAWDCAVTHGKIDTIKLLYVQYGCRYINYYCCLSIYNNRVAAFFLLLSYKPDMRQDMFATAIAYNDAIAIGIWNQSDQAARDSMLLDIANHDLRFKLFFVCISAKNWLTNFYIETCRLQTKEN